MAIEVAGLNPPCTTRVHGCLQISRRERERDSSPQLALINFVKYQHINLDVLTV